MEGGEFFLKGDRKMMIFLQVNNLWQNFHHHCDGWLQSYLLVMTMVTLPCDQVSSHDLKAINPNQHL
jgi:hypothetical protein